MKKKAFMTQCESGTAAAAPTAAPAATGAAAAATKGTAKGQAGKQAEMARMHKCSADRKAAKAAGQQVLPWPQYWHQCDMRMKQAGM